LRNYSLSIVTKLPDGTSSMSGCTGSGKSVTDFLLDNLAFLGTGRVVQAHIIEDQAKAEQKQEDVQNVV
jgi:hypothetical protein